MLVTDPSVLTPAKRVLVYGVTGSGKSTLAAQIAQVTGREWTSVDDLTFEPNWVSVPADRQRHIFSEICGQEWWLLDTAYGQWLDVPLARVELIVALDYPRWFSFGRLLRRTIARATDGRKVCGDNRESWRLMFSRESILLWHFRAFASKKRRISAWSADPAAPAVLRFQTARQAKEWVSAGCPGVARPG